MTNHPKSPIKQDGEIQTPPSTLARKAAEEIGKYLDTFTPLSPGADMIRIFERAIIERCFAAESEKGK